MLENLSPQFIIAEDSKEMTYSRMRIILHWCKPSVTTSVYKCKRLACILNVTENNVCTADGQVFGLSAKLHFLQKKSVRYLVLFPSSDERVRGNYSQSLGSVQWWVTALSNWPSRGSTAHSFTSGRKQSGFRNAMLLYTPGGWQITKTRKS